MDDQVMQSVIYTDSCNLDSPNCGRNVLGPETSQCP